MDKYWKDLKNYNKLVEIYKIQNHKTYILNYLLDNNINKINFTMIKVFQNVLDNKQQIKKPKYKNQ